jgi:hypothetical protein
MWKFTTLLFLIILPITSFCQSLILKGTVIDGLTSKPISEVNIKIKGTTIGNSTDNTGSFTLKLAKIPVTLVLSCIGYEDAQFEVITVPEFQLEFMMRPKSYSLPPVDISSTKYSFMFRDKDYSVLDYELMDDKVLLLVYRYELKNSRLILLSADGDTLANNDPPDMPAYLYKDFLENIHYLSKAGNAYQCSYNSNDDKLRFVNKTTSDSLFLWVKPFIFKLSDRLYFQDKQANGYGTGIGYYEKGADKKYIMKSISIGKIHEFIDDLKFYVSWNNFYRTSGFGIPSANNVGENDSETDPDFDFSSSRTEGGLYGGNEARAHQIEYYNMIFPVIKTKENTIAFFNFGSDIIDFLDENGNILRKVPIGFHKEIRTETEWRWGSKIIEDKYSGNVYTTFIHHGMVKIRKIDLETGKLNFGTVLPYPFPEKIEIHKGIAFFLIKLDGFNDKWKLVKCQVE